MSEKCEVTGMSTDNANSFNYYHSQLIGELNIEITAKDSLSKYENSLEKTWKNSMPHKSEKSRKNRLLNHITKSIGSKFNAVDVIQFGSSANGFGMKNGDFDICLIIPDANQRQLIKKMKNILRSQGMEDVHAILNAKVPILKFKDPRSGLKVDLSINNSLANYNTKMLNAYSNLSELIRNYVICIKYWALHRNISEPRNGTFSSYAWTLLALNHLIEEKVIPNLQSTENKTLVEIDGADFDVSFDEPKDFKISEDVTISSLVSGFFMKYATWDWKNKVVSIRNGGSVQRDEKSWMDEEPSALDLLNLEKIDSKLGPHHLAVEDPFEHDHDLSSVLSVIGELSVRNEIIRAAKMFGENKNWAEICETVMPERFQDMEPEDLFHDLRSKSTKDVENLKSKLQGEMKATETRISALESEKKSAIRMSQAMKGAIEETSDLRSEHKKIIVGLKTRNKDISDKKAKRDKINNDVILPLHMIEDELVKVYTRLTEELDVHRVPSLEKETTLFSWFFELQSMHAKATEASKLHLEYVELIKEQKSDIDQLKIFESKHDEATAKLLEDEPLLKDANLTKSGAKSYDRRVYNIRRALQERKGELQKQRREMGRLDAWLRIQSGSKSGGRKPRGKKGGKKERTISGPVTLGDLSDMFSNSSDKKDGKKVKKVNSKKAGMKKLGNLSAHRGSRTTYKRKD